MYIMKKIIVYSKPDYLGACIPVRLDDKQRELLKVILKDDEIVEIENTPESGGVGGIINTHHIDAIIIDKTTAKKNEMSIFHEKYPDIKIIFRVTFSKMMIDETVKVFGYFEVAKRYKYVEIYDYECERYHLPE